MTATTIKPTAPIRRILAAIAGGSSWRASAETVERALVEGWMVRNEDFAAAGPYSLTRKGALAVGAALPDGVREEMFERASALLRQARAEEHESRLIQMPRASRYMTPR